MKGLQFCHLFIFWSTLNSSMAARPKELVFLFMVLWAQVIKGHGSSAPSALNCSGTFFSFADCLDFVEDGSMVAKPGKACCTGLEVVVSQSVACLCEVLRDGSRFGIPINMTRALLLTSLCRVFAQPMEHCVIGMWYMSCSLLVHCAPESSDICVMLRVIADIYLYFYKKKKREG